MVEAFSEVGLRQSIIQNKRGSDDDFLNIIWWLSTIKGLAIYCLAYAAAPFIGEFFNRPESTMVLRVGFLVIPLNALVSPRITVLEKNIQFMKWAILMQGSAVAGVIITVVLAFHFQNVWALILGAVSESVFKCILSYIYCPIIPVLKFNTACLKDILSFSRGMYGLPIMMLLFAQTDVVIIGKVLSIELLGLYIVARGLSEVTVNFYGKIALPVLLPSYSMLRDNIDKLRKVLLDTTNIVATLAIPLFCFLILFSDILLSLLYGKAYGTVAVPFSCLCAYSFMYICSTIVMSAFIAIGKPAIQRTAAASRTVILLILIYPATRIYGLTGATAALLVAVIVSLVIQQYYLRKIMTISLAEYTRTWALGAKISLIVIIPGILFRLMMASQDAAVVTSGLFLCMLAWLVGFINLPLVREKLLTDNVKTIV